MKKEINLSEKIQKEIAKGFWFEFLVRQIKINKNQKTLKYFHSFSYLRVDKNLIYLS